MILVLFLEVTGLQFLLFLFVFCWMRIRGLCKLPARRDWLWGKLGLTLVGRDMLSKSLVQFSVDGKSCTCTSPPPPQPSLLSGLRQPSPGVYRIYDRANGNLLQENLCQHAAPPKIAVASAADPVQATVDPQFCQGLPNTYR